MRVALFFTILALVVLLSWWRGRTEERQAAFICVAGTALTHLADPSLHTRFADFDLYGFLVDVAVLLAFTAIALRSSRFWPLWVAGLQLTATSVHLLKLIEPDLMRFVFGAALAFWSYPILLLIAVGALRADLIDRWRQQQRERELLPDAR